MYDFLITILLGLALFKIVDLLEEVMPGVTRLHNVVTLVLALVGVWALDYSIFRGYGINLRNADMGVWMTGLFVAGTTSVWRALFHWLGTSEGEEPAVRHMHSARAA
jgi:hypothetical protein